MMNRQLDKIFKKVLPFIVSSTITSQAATLAHHEIIS